LTNIVIGDIIMRYWWITEIYEWKILFFIYTL